MKTFIVIFALTFSSITQAGTLKCNTVGKDDFGITYTDQIKITFPKDAAAFLLLQDHKETSGTTIAFVSEGVVEIDNRRHKFVITQLPHTESGTSLIGFYLEAKRVHSLRVDTWQEGFPVYYYNSWRNAFSKGSCS